MGFQQRTEFNKRILKIGENGAEITPAGGFLNYGVIRSAYVVIKGSVRAQQSALSVSARQSARENMLYGRPRSSL